MTDTQMVTVVVSASGSGETYHTNPDCHALAKSKTRQVAKHKVPNLALCERCAGGGVGGAKTQSRDINNFVKNLDASDVERGKLSETISEECE